jgi:IS605 OrfB family transposase
VSFATFKYRIKDARTASRLAAYAFASNQVWNFCCEVQRKAQAKWAAGLSTRWPSAFDLEKLTAGSSVELGIHSDTINLICAQFARARDRAHHCPRFRASRGPRRALGWIPFKRRAIRIDGDALIYCKQRFRFWKSREIEGAPRTGAFVQDARGRWYVTFQCEVEDRLAAGDGQVGIDLGLKALATLSTGEAVPALRHYRRYEQALGRAQRARRKPLVRAIHAKIANARTHHLHEQSTRIARENRLIVVGNVSPSKLAKTRMAKSVLDAGWSAFKNQLRYKASRHGAVFVEVNEAWTTRTCSACGTIPASSPKGMGALGMRVWVCSECGESHDRDINAARNILRLGLERQPPAGEIRIAA